MDDIFNQMSNIIPAKYKDLFLISMVVGRVIQSFRTGTGLKGMLSSIWLGTGQPKPPTTKDQTPTASNGTTTLPLLLLGALLIGCTPCVTGCKSTPAKIAVNASDSARITVEAALGAWDAYIVKNHPPLKQQEAVRSAWLTYKQAQLVVLDTAILLKQAQNAGGNTSGAQSALSGAIVDASNALADMLKLLRQFGVKI
jgi:hypothetical protein